MKASVWPVMAVVLFIFLPSLYSCASPASKLPSTPPQFVYNPTPPRQAPADGSLWSEGPSIYEDKRARRVNDLITIKIVENIQADNKAETTANKQSSYGAGVSNLFNVSANTLGMKNGAAAKNQLTTSNNDKFKAQGETKNQNVLTGSITAKVVDVQPNGNLVIDGRKEITINYEKQIIVLQGIIRPDDVDVTNTVASQNVADARLYIVGDGVLQELQSPGWLGRFFQKVWPF
ncbi:MAG: flagellar basal body L-ring protein FlgH [Nitrospirae bacterium]|nr:flagellar basal body L-ring protein FlgH [Nitrospirota bacterium]